VRTRTRATTIRIPSDIYESSSNVARRRGVSLNQLVKESLEALLKAEESQRLYEAFTLVAADAEEADVEFALHAQNEVVSRGEP
jgi:predicted DNA-binding protein